MGYYRNLYHTNLSWSRKGEYRFQGLTCLHRVRVVSAFPELHFGLLAQWQVQGWKYKINFHQKRKLMTMQWCSGVYQLNFWQRRANHDLDFGDKLCMTEKKVPETFRWFILNSYLPKISTALFTTAARWNTDEQSMFFQFTAILFKYQLTPLILFVWNATLETFTQDIQLLFRL